MRAGVRLLFVAAFLGSCGGSKSSGPLTRGPQVAQVGTTEALVAFLTPNAVVAEVEYGPTPSYGATVADATATAEHVLALTGLAPGAACHYRIRIDGTVVSEGHAFRTAPASPDAPLRIIALGDVGAGTAAQSDLAALLGTFSPDLILVAGDAVYERGAPFELGPGYFRPYRDVLDDIPFYVALGNHDVDWDGGTTLLDSLYLPVNDSDLTERFYSFDVGGAHVVALDSNGDLDPPSAQLDWLSADLAAHAGARWTFVFFHHAPWSPGPHGGDAVVEANVSPLLEGAGVDLVVTGHNHIYHRSFPLSGGVAVDAAQEPDYIDPAGTVYVVTGGGGKSLHATATLPFTAFTESAYHFVVLDVAGASLTLRAIRRDGTEMDRMTITKTP